MHSKTVLILGAAGRLGHCLVSAFATAGWQVIAQARKPQSLQAGVRALTCDALDVPALVAGAAEARVVINALNPPYTEWKRLLPPLADAAQRTAQALGALLMLAGNVYNFGRELPEVLQPGTPELGNTSRAALRIAMEARMAAAAPGLDSVVLRVGDFFGGGGRGSWFDQATVGQFKRGKVIHPGGLSTVHAWAYLPDLAATFVRVAEARDALRGHHKLHFAGHAVDGQTLHAALEAASGRSLKASSLPWGFIRLMAPLVPSWRAMVEMRYLWQRPHRLDDSHLRALIGPPPATPLVQALRQSLIDLRLVEAQPSAAFFSAKAAS
jgi:nucleoside-diphosphate-sugar epimerase